jgi:hypothetical protein
MSATAPCLGDQIFFQILCLQNIAVSLQGFTISSDMTWLTLLSYFQIAEYIWLTSFFTSFDYFFVQVFNVIFVFFTEMATT